jgi:hypothetical protein
MMKIQRLAKAALPSTSLLLALLFLFFIGISPAAASSLEILSPKADTIVTSTTVTVNVSYSHSTSKPDPKTGKHDECWALDCFVQKSDQAKQRIDRRDVPNENGTESFTVNLAGAQEGTYKIEAVLI